jgi:hypothetical protein
MEQFIRTLGDALDRRSFIRRLGKVGMGAAAVAGVLLLPKEASAVCTNLCSNKSGACKGACEGELGGCGVVGGNQEHCHHHGGPPGHCSCTTLT